MPDEGCLDPRVGLCGHTKQDVEGVSNTCSQRLLSCHGQDHAQLHHRSSIMLFTISQRRNAGAIEHRFGRHLRLHGLGCYFAYKKA